MNVTNRFALTMICFGLVIAASVLIKKPASSEWPKPDVIVQDYTQLNQAVAEVLKDMPEMEEELELARSGRVAEPLLSLKKAEFRIRIENNLTKQEHSPEFMRSMAEKETERFAELLRVASEEYGVAVNEEEVTAFIRERTATDEEKKRYAEALGLTLEELDEGFDRDLYVMEWVWRELKPLVKEEYPKREGESEQAYGERWRNEFITP